tara:strand:+ start:222 stop:821 length:600 start_codon:yes stop_codon:yes gene_type:complete
MRHTWGGIVDHVWEFEQWSMLSLSQVKEKLLSVISKSSKLGDISVRNLCCMARDEWCPVGIYVFVEDGDVMYVGKTHGRSFQERMLSHLDHRDPLKGSPHLAQLVQSMCKKGEVVSASEGVQRLLNMQMMWLPVPRTDLESPQHKEFIAIVERRLLWHKCLDPHYNSPRVKKNDYFTLKGQKFSLSSETVLGDFIRVTT